jgi:hypothetical protein
MITKFGKRFITSYLAGMVSFPKQDIAIGISSTAPDSSGNDTRLGFEFYRLPSAFGSIDIQTDELGATTYAVVYKTTLPQDVAGVIKEIGLYPSSRTSINNYDSKFLSDFENHLLWSDANGDKPLLVQSTTGLSVPSIGAYFIKSSASASSSTEYVASIANIDLSGYSSSDSISLAFNQEDLNLSSIKVKLYSSDTAYHYVTFDGTEINTGTGNKILNRALSTLQTTNSPTSSIIKIGVEVTAKSSGEAVVYFDGLRVNDEDTFDPKFGLISRSVLSTPLEKVAGRPVDIEYRIGINF